MAKFKLDFSINSSKDRLAAIKNIPLDTLNKSELETVTNYVLYGKDEDGTSCVDRKEVQIKTKFNSYNKEKIVSLDEMMENPAFDETIFQNQQDKAIYKKPKPSIDRERAKNIPGMIELWQEIDKFANILDQNQGKKPFEEGTPRLNQKDIYYLTHYLIQLRKQQYYLWDSQYSSMIAHKNRAEYHGNIVDSQMNYPIYPRGVMRKEDDTDFMVPRHDKSKDFNIVTEEEIQKLKEAGKPYFDFTNEEHVYQLIQHYQEIKYYIEQQPDSLLNNLLWTLDFYIEKAGLSEQQALIVRDKKNRCPNKEIAQHLHDELGIYHQENYISTIWNKTVKLITDAVQLNFDEYLCRNYNKAWKTCSRCKKELLRDPRNFVKKAKSSDGLTGRCKQCDKELRQMGK